MAKLEKSLYKLCHHKVQNYRAFPISAAMFIVQCIGKGTLSYTNFKSHALLRSSNAREILHTGSWLKEVKERGHFEHLGVDGRIISE
jgi:hypothetical protein